MTAIWSDRGQGLGLVMGDVDGGDADLALQALELDAHLLAQLGVEVGQGLVQEQQARGLDDGAGQGDALLLAARQAGGRARLEAGQVDGPQRLIHHLLDLAT